MMFRDADIRMAVRKIALKLEEDDDDVARICEITFRIGRLGIELAEAIVGIPVVTYCFTNDLPRWEVNDVKFTPPGGHFVVSLKSAPDMPRPLVEIVDASITGVRVWRANTDKRDLSFEFATKYQLGANVQDLADLLTAWERHVAFVTMTEIRPPLLSELDAPRRPEERS
jgi:hypothetical protein